MSEQNDKKISEAMEDPIQPDTTNDCNFNFSYNVKKTNSDSTNFTQGVSLSHELSGTVLTRQLIVDDVTNYELLSIKIIDGNGNEEVLAFDNMQEKEVNTISGKYAIFWDINLPEFTEECILSSAINNPLYNAENPNYDGTKSGPYVKVYGCKVGENLELEIDYQNVLKDQDIVLHRYDDDGYYEKLEEGGVLPERYSYTTRGNKTTGTFSLTIPAGLGKLAVFVAPAGLGWPAKIASWGYYPDDLEKKCRISVEQGQKLFNIRATKAMIGRNLVLETDGKGDPPYHKEVLEITDAVPWPEEETETQQNTKSGVVVSGTGMEELYCYCAAGTSVALTNAYQTIVTEEDDETIPPGGGGGGGGGGGADLPSDGPSSGSSESTSTQSGQSGESGQSEQSEGTAGSSAESSEQSVHVDPPNTFPITEESSGVTSSGEDEESLIEASGTSPIVPSGGPVVIEQSSGGPSSAPPSAPPSGKGSASNDVCKYPSSEYGRFPHQECFDDCICNEGEKDEFLALGAVTTVSEPVGKFKFGDQPDGNYQLCGPCEVESSGASSDGCNNRCEFDGTCFDAALYSIDPEGEDSCTMVETKLPHPSGNGQLIPGPCKIECKKPDVQSSGAPSSASASASGGTVGSLGTVGSSGESSDASSVQNSGSNGSGSCDWYDCAGVCNGNAVADCKGKCGGSAVLDDCGVCDGNNKDKDSCGVCNGNDEDIDECGVCFGNNASKDCTGVCDGPAVEDCEGECNGSAVRDCMGLCNGTATTNACGSCCREDDAVCKSKVRDCTNRCVNPLDAQSFDCDGVCGGGNTPPCEECPLPQEFDPKSGVQKDCAGSCDLTHTVDCTGSCVPNDQAAKKDCAGVCGGTAVEDCAGVCGGTTVVDCKGVCGGTGPCDPECPARASRWAEILNLPKESEYKKHGIKVLDGDMISIPHHSINNFLKIKEFDLRGNIIRPRSVSMFLSANCPDAVDDPHITTFFGDAYQL